MTCMVINLLYFKVQEINKTLSLTYGGYSDTNKILTSCVYQFGMIISRLLASTQLSKPLQTHTTDIQRSV